MFPVHYDSMWRGYKRTETAFWTGEPWSGEKRQERGETDRGRRPGQGGGMISWGGTQAACGSASCSVRSI